MSWKFAEKYAHLINHNVPRTFLRNITVDTSDIPAQRPLLATDELPKPPSDGFIATYCSEDSKNQDL